MYTYSTAAELIDFFIPTYYTYSTAAELIDFFFAAVCAMWQQQQS